MKKFGIAVFVGLALAGCGKESQIQAADTAHAVAPAPIKDHNYSLKDGFEYGYERDVTIEEANNGKAASSLLMTRFAGQHDGKYQVYMKADQVPGTIVVAECTNPCEFMKSMVFYQGEHQSTERIRVAPGIIGWMMLEDAINDKLEQFVLDNNGKKYNVWFDEKKGITKSLANAPIKAL